MTLRIAISGCAGSGKSSLAKALAEKLQLPLISEMYEPLFDAPGKFAQPPQQLAATFLQIFNVKQQLENQHSSFVTDRCSIDLYNLWMTKGLGRLLEETEAFFEQALQQTTQYDLVVIPPGGIIRTVSSHEAGDSRRRVTNRYVQMYNHAAITGLATLWLPPERLLRLPDIPQSVEERGEEVMRQISVMIPIPHQ